MESLSALCQILYDLVQICGLMQISDSINTISWSLIPGSGLQDKIKDGILVIYIYEASCEVHHLG